MVEMTAELRDYLEFSDSPKQVLVKVRKRHQPRPLRSNGESRYDSQRFAAEQNRSELIKALKEEQAHDHRVEFNPIGMFNQVALKAPPDVITRIAARKDVDKVVPDEPTDVVGDFGL